MIFYKIEKNYKPPSYYTICGKYFGLKRCMCFKNGLFSDVYKIVFKIPTETNVYLPVYMYDLVDGNSLFFNHQVYSLVYSLVHKQVDINKIVKDNLYIFKYGLL